MSAQHVLDRLKALDLDAMRAQAYADARSGKKTRRQAAIKVLRVLDGLKRSGARVDDLLVKRVPVIPPAFRPYTAAGETFIPGDANELYSDLIQARDIHNETVENLGPEGAMDTARYLRNAVRAVYGYGESPNPKIKSRGVSGFLSKVLGGGPKTSFVQQKMISKPQDFVGRAVISPDPDLGMDEIGLPEDMAWELYDPHVRRRLIAKGIPASRAIRLIKDRQPEARHQLLAEMAVRPVLSSRAPAWHKFSFLAAYPKLTEGDNIKISPYVSAGLNADYDGNCIVGSVNILLKLRGSVVGGLNADCPDTYIKFGVDNREGEEHNERRMKITGETIVKFAGADHVVVELPIRQIPVKATPPKKDRNGADVFEIVEGVQMLTNIPDREGVRWADVTHLTVEHGCDIVDLLTVSGKSVGISTNESIPVPDGAGGLVKVKPSDAVGQLVPVTHSFPLDGDYGDLEWGWVVGSFLSDGWWSDGYVGYTKADDAKRHRFLRGFCKHVGFDEEAVKRYEAVHAADSNSGIGGIGKKLHFAAGGITGHAAGYLRDQCYDREALALRGEDQRACLFKKMPDNLWEMSTEMLLGVLSGLFDGDGSISISNGKGKPQVVANISTSAPRLRDGIMELMRRLGIRSSFTTVKPKPGRAQRHANYVITPCMPDLARRARELKLTAASPALSLLMESPAMKDDRDIVPIPREFVSRLIALNPSGISRGSLRVLSSRWRGRAYVSVSRATALAWIASYTQAGGAADSVLEAAENYVHSTDLHWEKVDSITPRPTEPVYDVVVPSTKVFVISNGLVVFDTMAVHAPVLPEAVRDAKEKLLPSRMLFSIRDRDDTLAVPKHEQLLGLAGSQLRPSGTVHRFSSADEALEAIKAGRVRLQDTVELPE